MSFILENAKFVPFAIIAILVILLLACGYVKAPPDQAYIISGLGRKSRILIGQAGIRIPFLERLDKLYLGQMTVDIKTEQSVPTNDFINVDVDSVAKVRINSSAENIMLAAKNFLNKKPSAITQDLQDSLQGNMREIIGTLSLKQINTDRDSFSDQVMEKASHDMSKLGIEILSCNIQNVTDENGLIKDLGADNTSLIKKNASIAKAQADRDIAIAQAEADREANEARVAADSAIAIQQNNLAIKKAELQIAADTKKAEADAAYSIQQENQRKTVETARVNADIATAERDAELKRNQVEVKKQTLDAEVRAQADADRYATEQIAEASLFRRQKEAEASLYERQQEAEAQKSVAAAAMYAKTQEAEGIRAIGAAVEMIMQALPEIAKNVAEPLSKVDRITMFGEGNNTKLLEDIVKGTTQVTEGMLNGVGVDLKSVLAGFFGGKLAGDRVPVLPSPAPHIVAADDAESASPKEDPGDAEK